MVCIGTLTSHLSQVPPILFKVCRNFKEGHHIDELKNKYSLKLYFSQTLIFTGFFDFSLIKGLQLNRMYVTSFWFHSKLVLEKAKKPASYELPIHTFFNILHNFFQKRVLDIFKWTFWQTSFHQVLYSNKGVLYLRSFMSSKTSLPTSIPENVSPWLWF